MIVDTLNNRENRRLSKEKFGELMKKIHLEILKAFKDSDYKIKEQHFMDGYFVFDHGENTVMHFKLEESPDWKFGIWLTPEIDLDGNIKEIIVEIFSQVEVFIDKFKPSRSEFSSSFKLRHFDADNRYRDEDTSVFIEDFDDIYIGIIDDWHVVTPFDMILKAEAAAFIKDVEYISDWEISRTSYRKLVRRKKKLLKEEIDREKLEEKIKTKSTKKIIKEMKKELNFWGLTDVEFIDRNKNSDGWISSPGHRIVINMNRKQFVLFSGYITNKLDKINDQIWKKKFEKKADKHTLLFRSDVGRLPDIFVEGVGFRSLIWNLNEEGNMAYYMSFDVVRSGIKSTIETNFDDITDDEVDLIFESHLQFIEEQRRK